MGKAVFRDSDEEFLILMSLVHPASAPTEQKRFKTTSDSFGDSTDFTERFDYRILYDLSSFIDAVHHIATGEVETFDLDVKRFASLRNHGFDTPELLSSGGTDFDEVR